MATHAGGRSCCRSRFWEEWHDFPRIPTSYSSTVVDSINQLSPWISQSFIPKSTSRAKLRSWKSWCRDSTAQGFPARKCHSCHSCHSAGKAAEAEGPASFCRSKAIQGRNCTHAVLHLLHSTLLPLWVVLWGYVPSICRIPTSSLNIPNRGVGHMFFFEPRILYTAPEFVMPSPNRTFLLFVPNLAFWPRILSNIFPSEMLKRAAYSLVSPGRHSWEEEEGEEGEGDQKPKVTQSPSTWYPNVFFGPKVILTVRGPIAWNIDVLDLQNYGLTVMAHCHLLYTKCRIFWYTIS